MERADEKAGYFSQESKLWELNRARVVLFAGPRALLMQIAHPMIAEAVHSNGEFQREPLTRMKRTADMGLTIIFGTKQKADSVAQRITRVHQNVQGTLEQQVGPHPQAATYSAKDLHLQTWVYSTLVDSVITGYSAFVRPLEEEEKETYYQESKEIAWLLGMDKDALPATYEDLQSFMNKVMDEEISVGPKARELAPLIFRPKNSPGSKIAEPILKFVTAGLLPAKLRRDFGLPWKPYMNDWFSLTSKVIQQTSALLPEEVRYVPHYREAVRKFGA